MKDKIKAENYGEVLAQINDLELVSYEQDGGYQGTYLVICKDENRLFYFVDSYGSCSGCDWLEDVSDLNRSEIPYKEALDYCGGIKPKFIVPLNSKLKVKILGEHEGFEIGGIKFN